MGILSALADIASAPIRCADELVKDLTGNNKNEEADGMLSILTCGASSVLKGVAKSVEKAAKDLDKGDK